MSNDKKYYWLKLKEDFFSQPQIKKLRKIAGGDTYTIIYQKIMLLSIKNGGLIQFQNIEKTLVEELALILDEDLDNIKMVISFMESTNLLEYDNDNNFFIPSVIDLIGSQTNAAARMKKMRERNNVTPLLHDVTPLLHDVTPLLHDVTQREERREKKKDIEIEIEIEIKNIYKYWNEKTGQDLKGDKQIIKSLETILKDYKVDDIKLVINYMVLNTWFKQSGNLAISVLARPTKFGDKLDKARIYKPIKPPNKFIDDSIGNCNSQDYTQMGDFK